MKQIPDGWKQKQRLIPRVSDYLEAAREIRQQYPGKYGIWFLQVKLKIGYNLAKQLVIKLEEESCDTGK